MNRNVPFPVAAGLLLMLVGFIGLTAENLDYRETTSGRSESHCYRIEPFGSGFLVTLQRRGVGVALDDEFETDAEFSTRRWRFHDASDNTHVEAFREGDVIHLSGVHDNNAIRREFHIDRSPWKQIFALDFESFIRSPEKEFSFWSIGTSGAGDMKIARFSARKKGARQVMVNGLPVDAVGLRLSLTGLLSLFWHGDYWFRKSDGRYLLYEGRNGFIAAVTRKELVAED